VGGGGGGDKGSKVSSRKWVGRGGGDGVGVVGWPGQRLAGLVC
jgi:hypothetical protein